jgi:hypothetical protein
MEISATIKEIGETELKLETAEQETLHLPKRLFLGATVGQTVYITTANEPGRPAREIVNELLGSNEPS